MRSLGVQALTLIASALAWQSACTGHPPDGVVIGTAAAPFDAGVSAPPVAPASIADSGVTSDAASEAAALGAPASCLPRASELDAGEGVTCNSSRDCALGSICCAHEGDATGVCSSTACGSKTPRQRCVADCECLAGRCGNAWPYIIYGDCR